MALTDLADWENKIYLYSQYILGSMVDKHVSEPYLQGSVHPLFTYMTINIAYSHNIANDLITQLRKKKYFS